MRLGDTVAAIGAIRGARSVGEVLAALDAGPSQLGVDQIAFAIWLDGFNARRFHMMAVGDGAGAWGVEYTQQQRQRFDAWLDYAEANTGPAIDLDIPLATREQVRTRRLAREHGVASALVVPSPGGWPVRRQAVLLLGSRVPGWFEGSALADLSVVARSLALELHDWWGRRVRDEVLRHLRLSEADLALLRMADQPTKRVARETGRSENSVNWAFQRINRAFGRRKREDSAKLAWAYGLLPVPSRG